MPVQDHDSEVIEVLEPHATIVKIGAVVFAFLFVAFSIFHASVVKKSQVLATVDSDGDGFSDEIESFVGTDPSAACSRDSSHAAWPVDMNNDRNVELADMDIAKVAINSVRGDGRYNARYDLTADGKINVSDLSVFLAPVRYLDRTCTYTPPVTPTPTPTPTPSPSPSPVPQPTIKTFMKDPQIIYKGGSVGITWWAENATGCTASSSPGTLFASDASSWNGPKNYSGSAIVIPLAGTILGIKCDGAGGSVEGTLPIAVLPACGATGSPIVNRHLYYSAGSPAVYVIENCAKRWIINRTVFDACSYDWSERDETRKGYLDYMVSYSDVTGPPCPPGPKVGSVHLRVHQVDASGNTISFINGATVKLTNTSGTTVYRTVTSSTSCDTATTNNLCGDGWVWFDKVSTGTYGVMAYKTGYSGKWKEADCSTGGTTSDATINNSQTGGLSAAWDGNVVIVGGNIAWCQDLGLMATAPSPPPPIGDPGKDAIREYIKNYVGGWNVRRTIRGYNLNYGRFLWGMAGCESGWNPLDFNDRPYNGVYYYEKGLYQYQAKNISGYPNSPYDTWGSTKVSAGLSNADIWNYQHQVQVTSWKVSPGQGNSPGTWTCWNWWVDGSGRRNWTWFTDAWPDPNF